MGAALFPPSVRIFTFDDVKIRLNDPNYIIISTLSCDSQNGLIQNTILWDIEESIINNIIKNKSKQIVIVYGKNWGDKTIHDKCTQLIRLGITPCVYMGGMFEWLCMQDIYGSDEFPTVCEELDILKYKPMSVI